MADWRSSEANKAKGAKADFDEAFRRCMREEPHAPQSGLQEAGADVGVQRLAALRGTEGWLGALLEDLRSERLLPPWLPQPDGAAAGQRSEAVQSKALKTPTAWLDPTSEVNALEDSAVWRALDEIAPPKLEVSSGKAVAAVGGAAGSEGAGTNASRKSLQGAHQSTAAKRPSAAEPSTAREERKDKIAEESKEETAEEAKPEGEEGYFSAFGAAMYSAFAGGEEEGAAEAPPQPLAAEAAPAEQAQEQEPQVEEQVQPAGGEEEDGYFTGFGAAMYSAFGGGGEEEAEPRTAPEDAGRKSIIKVQEWGAQASGNARARRAERRKQRGGDG